ncbi:MAG: aminopeptidase P family protein [Chitinispirillaceae bacterium]|nr:aminopeptidase P family protein [Chitinispirillaceae bacterium]
MQRKRHEEKRGKTTDFYSISRFNKLRRMLEKEELTYFLITDPIDVAYVTGFLSTYVALLIGKKSHWLLTDFRYALEAITFCKRHPEWKFIQVDNGLYNAIANIIKCKECKIGFQSDRMSVEEFRKFKSCLREVSFKCYGREIKELLIPKEPFEIDTIKKAATIADKAFLKILDDIKPGITECVLVKKLEDYCRELGSERAAFETIILSGERSALPHGRPTNKKIKKGEFVLIDFGCTVDGFLSDMTRTVVVGKANSKQKEIYNIVYEAQKNARENARAKMKANEIDFFGREIIKCKGYGRAFGHALGHGVGRRIHESPRISREVKLEVPLNAVVTIEPGIYIPDFGGVRIEDLVVIEKNGVSLLSNSPRELIEL